MWVILDTTFRRGTGKKSVGLSTPSPSPTKSASFTYDRIPDSLSPTPSPISQSSSNGFRSRSPSLEFRTTLVDPGAVHLNGSSVHYRECFNCKMPIFDVRLIKWMNFHLVRFLYIYFNKSVSGKYVRSGSFMAFRLFHVHSLHSEIGC